MRTPTAEEVRWIRAKCRYNPRELARDMTGAEDEVIQRVLEI